MADDETIDNEAPGTGAAPSVSQVPEGVIAPEGKTASASVTGGANGTSPANGANGAYRARVVGLALLGYAYVFLVLGAGVAVVGGLGLLMAHGGFMAVLALKKLLFVLLGFCWITFSALWVRLTPPTGIRLTRADCPTLFDALDGIRAQLLAPPIHCVLLDGDFNAAICQCPRLGILGWPRNYLLLGLPLLQAVTPEQALAVVAHEYGHLARAHGRLGNWIHRARISWARLREVFAEEGWANRIAFGWFLRWYTPLFLRESFALARANEYEADQASAALVGAPETAAALCATRIRGQLIDTDFWPMVLRRANQVPRLERHPYLDLEVLLRTRGDPTAAASCLERAMAEPSSPHDTHPSLKERLAALGQAPSVPDPPLHSAARVFLGERAEEWTRQLSEEWWEAIRGRWEERFQEAQQAKARIAALRGRAAAALAQAASSSEAPAPAGALPALVLSLEEQVEWACLVEEFDASAGAGAGVGSEPEALLRAALAQDPGHGGANLHLGRILLERGDEAALPLLERAMECSPELVPGICERIFRFLLAQGRPAEAMPYADRGCAAADRLRRAAVARHAVDGKTRFRPHGLAPEAVVQLAARIKVYNEAEGKKLKAVYLCQKVVPETEAPMYVLAVEFRDFSYLSEARARAVLEGLLPVLDLPETIHGKLKDLDWSIRRRIRKVAGARVF
jgi:Zn-dependent protease with chaperone function